MNQRPSKAQKESPVEKNVTLVKKTGVTECLQCSRCCAKSFNKLPQGIFLIPVLHSHVTDEETETHQGLRW